MRVALYVRISSHDRQTLAMPIDAMRPEERKATAAAAATLSGQRRRVQGSGMGLGHQACRA